MPTISTGLVTICWALLIKLTSCGDCPAQYVCKWEHGVYVLHCNPIVENYRYHEVASGIRDLPRKATRVKIKCFSKKIVARLKFYRVTTIREISLDTFTVPSGYLKVFNGFSHLRTLTLRNLYLRSIEMYTFVGLIRLHSLFVEKLDDLEYMHPWAM